MYKLFVPNVSFHWKNYFRTNVVPLNKTLLVQVPTLPLPSCVILEGHFSWTLTSKLMGLDQINVSRSWPFNENNHSIKHLLKAQIPCSPPPGDLAESDWGGAHTGPGSWKLSVLALLFKSLEH